MKLRTGFLGLTLAGVVALASANAADMYVPGPAGYKDAPAPVQPWEGSYVGINGGFAWGASDRLTQNETYPDTAIGASASFSPEGGFGGGQIGHNWQRDHLVFGVEADIEGSSIGGSATVNPNSTTWAHGSSSLDWFGTVRGRLGYAFDRVLVYGTGGFAYGGVEDKLSKADPLTGSVSDNNTATGYVVGGGLEYAVAPAWSVKAEYQYIDLGKDTLSLDAVVVPKYLATLDADHAYSTVRLGVNYHILPAYEPLK